MTMNLQSQGSSLFAGNTGIFQNSGLKSTREKIQRQTQRDNQIAFLENQKKNLKNMDGDSLEEISRKLELFHSYEEQIAAVKEEYNQSQMFHAMDEARELGEEIAKAAEKYAPKTSEERREELVEEALGTDENKGELTESMEELAELSEPEEATGEMQDYALKNALEDAINGIASSESTPSEPEKIREIYKWVENKRIDIRI